LPLCALRAAKAEEKGSKHTGSGFMACNLHDEHEESRIVCIDVGITAKNFNAMEQLA
jgi:hypothetical protein